MILKYHDKSHSYYLDGKRCTSVTSVAKVLEDGYRLTNYQKRMVAIGLAASPDLVERVAAHFDERQTLDDLCEEAQQRAGAHKAAGKGTAAHRITERHDAGSDLIETEFSRRVRHAWQSVLDRHQLEVVLSERIVVWPDQLVAGRFDRICRRPDGSLVVVDLKTGDRAIQYPHSIAIQLALYAYAPLLAGEIPAAGGETEMFTYLTDYGSNKLDLGTAIVVHLPDGGEAQAYEFDIAAGYEAARLCFQALAWRRRKELCRPLDSEENDGDQAVAGSVERDVDDRGRVAGRPGTVGQGHGEPDLAVPAAQDEGTHQAPEALAAAIRALPTDRQEFMKQRWPADLPGPKAVVEQRATWNFVQITQIWILLQQANWACDETPEEQEAQQTAQRQAREELVGTSKPVAGTEEVGSAERIPSEQPAAEGVGSRALEEAGPADPDAVAALVARLKALDEERTKITSRWVNQAYQAGVPFGQITTNPTRRRFAIARAALALAEHMDGDDELVRMALALVLGEHNIPHPDFLPTGALLGSLHPDQADRLAEIADTFYQYTVCFDGADVGRLVLVPD